MKINVIKNILHIFVFIFITLFFTIYIVLPQLTLGATTTDAINITLTVDEAVVTPPSPPTGGGGPPGTPSTLQIIDVDVDVATSSVIVVWKTTRSAVSVFSWGTTTEYTLGILSEIDFAVEHMSVIENLIPDTLYYFFIEADDIQTGAQSYVGNFRTFALPDIIPPTNISDFEAIPGDEEIDLVWSNPLDEDFDIVRIVRSEDFFPLTPFDGIVVYEGRGTDAVDTEVKKGITYYYSAFALDENGNSSEGSIDSARLVIAGEPPEIGEPPFEEFPPAPPIEIHPLIDVFKLLHVDFIQDGKKIPHLSLDKVPIDGSKDLTISIDYDLLPEILKTIGITVTDPDDPTKTFSFLLRVTPDKKTYQTTLAPFDRGGIYSFGVHILDHKNQALKKLDGTMLVAATILLVPEIEVSVIVSEFLKTNICLFLLLLILLFLLFTTYLRLFRKVDGRKSYLFLFVLFFTVIVALLFFFRTRVNEQIFCLLFSVLLLFFLLYGTYRGLNHYLNKENTGDNF